MKSPISSHPKVKNQQNLGISHLENGEPFINGWPSQRKPQPLAQLPQQSVVEAAGWCEKDGKRQRHGYTVYGIQNHLQSLENNIHFSGQRRSKHVYAILLHGTGAYRG